MSNRATMQDVANAAGVSLSTVDRILNRRAGVKRATADLVLLAAQQLGFHGVPTIQGWLSESAPPATFGFLLNGQDRALYSDFAEMLSSRTRASTAVQGRAIMRHLTSLEPTETVRALEELGAECDAMAIVAIDTPEIHAAVERLANAGIPVITMLSDLSTPRRSAFVGANSWKMGRGAGWMIDRLTPRTGVIGLLIGSSDYHAHRGYRDGFLSYLRDYKSLLTVVEAGESLERDDRARDLTRALLNEKPDLSAIFVAGGGIGGVMAAIRMENRSDLVLVGTELSSEVDRALSDRLVDAVLSHPATMVTRNVVELLENAVRAGSHVKLSSRAVPITIRISETV